MRETLYCTAASPGANRTGTSRQGRNETVRMHRRRQGAKIINQSSYEFGFPENADTNRQLSLPAAS